MNGVRLILAGLCVTCLLPVACADDGIEGAMAATFRIDGNKSSGTCFFLQSEKAVLLVTAAHALEEVVGEECRINVPVKRQDDTYVAHETKIKVRDGGKPLWRKHCEVDVAVLPVELPADVSIVPFQLSQLGDEAVIEAKRVRVAQEVWIPCFPARLGSNDAGWPVLRRGAIASYPLGPTRAVKMFYIDTSAFGGDSGAPVLVHPEASQATSTTPPLIVGLVIGMHRQTDKSSLPFEERTVHMPLGLSIAVHAQLIRETIGLLDE